MIVTDCTGSCKSNYHTIITTTAPIYILNISTNKYICHFSVALTACSNSETVDVGDIVKFPDVIINYGIQNLTLFKQTGIFTCEQKGMYMFFSSMVSLSTNGYFRWYLNNSTSLSTIYVNKHNSYQSGSGMVTVELAVGDTVSLKPYNSYIRFDSASCYTLIKIK
jgi:hypothetical protein